MEELLVPILAAVLNTLADVIERNPGRIAALLRTAAGGFDGGPLPSLFSAFAPPHVPPPAPEPPGARDTVAPGADAAIIGLGLERPEGFVSDPPPPVAPALPFDGAPEPERIAG